MPTNKTPIWQDLGRQRGLLSGLGGGKLETRADATFL